MATATATATASLIPFAAGRVQNKKLECFSGFQSQLAVPRKSKLLKCRAVLSIRSAYSDGSKGGGGDFVAGFLLGGAIFGTLAYVFAPQIRKSLLNEDEHGFRKPKRPIYFDDGLEQKTRLTLNEKISQLNKAIDKVSSRLRGGNNVAESVVAETVEVDSELQSTI